MTPERTEAVARELARVLGDEAHEYPFPLEFTSKLWLGRKTAGAYLDLNNAGRLLAVARKRFNAECETGADKGRGAMTTAFFMKDMHDDCPAAIEAMLVALGELE